MAGQRVRPGRRVPVEPPASSRSASHGHARAQRRDRAGREVARTAAARAAGRRPARLRRTTETCITGIVPPGRGCHPRPSACRARTCRSRVSGATGPDPYRPGPRRPDHRGRGPPDSGPKDPPGRHSGGRRSGTAAGSGHGRPASARRVREPGGIDRRDRRRDRHRAAPRRVRRGLPRRVRGRPTSPRTTAVILGSGVFVPGRRSDGGGFLARHEASLAARPVWLFCAGPIGRGRCPAGVGRGRCRRLQRRPCRPGRRRPRSGRLRADRPAGGLGPGRAPGPGQHRARPGVGPGDRRGAAGAGSAASRRATVAPILSARGRGVVARGVRKPGTPPGCDSLGGTGRVQDAWPWKPESSR